MLFLANKNQFLVKHGIFLELVRWEFLSSSFSETRKQDDFNKVLDESEIFTCLIFDRIGQYTREEFDKAYQNYKQGKNPKKFYLYFKTLPKGKREEAIEVYELKKAIEKDEQIYREYKNPDQLKLFLNQNLDEDLPGILKEALLENIYEPEAKPMTQSISQELIDTLEEADRLLSINLTEKALDIYSNSLKKINKNKTDLYGKILTNIAQCYLNLSNYSNQEENLNIALLRIEEAMKWLSLDLQQYYYLKSILLRSQIYFNLSFIRQKYENLNKSIEIAKTSLDYFDKKSDSILFYELFLTIGYGYCFLMQSESNKQYYPLALNHFQRALSLINKETNHYEFCKTLSAITLLDSYYVFLISDLHEQINLLEKVIQDCRNILDTLSPEKYLSTYSATLCNLAGAYSYLGQIKNDSSLIMKAIEYSKKDLEIIRSQRNTYNLLTAMNNQSHYFLMLYKITNDKAYLSESIKLCNEALEKITIQEQPYWFSKFKIDLGLNYCFEALTESKKKKKSDLIRKSVEAYHDASMVLTESNYLHDFKLLHIYMAKSYSIWMDLEDSEIHKNNGLDCLRQVLKYYKGPVEKDKYYELASKLESVIQRK